MKFKRVNIDTSKSSGFILEKKIKEYKEGVDYEVDETGNSYTILSEGLKSAIWPDDYFWYDDSIVVIDRQGKVESYRMATDNPREPYKKVDRNFLKEIMNESDDSDKKKPVIKQQEDQKQKEAENREAVFKGDPRKINVISWVAGVSLLFSIPLYFIIKKMLICRRKSKKNCETKR